MNAFEWLATLTQILTLKHENLTLDTLIATTTKKWLDFLMKKPTLSIWTCYYD
jgi:hypothetical protein